MDTQQSGNKLQYTTTMMMLVRRWWVWLSEKIKIPSSSSSLPLCMSFENKAWNELFPSHSLSRTFFIYIIFVANTGERCCYFLRTSYDVDFNAQGLNVNFLLVFCFHADRRFLLLFLFLMFTFLHVIWLELFLLFIYRIF